MSKNNLTRKVTFTLKLQKTSGHDYRLCGKTLLNVQDNNAIIYLLITLCKLLISPLLSIDTGVFKNHESSLPLVLGLK